jgi:hypothetical protein
MARLPTPGGDSGTWGTVLNDFLNQVHNSNGTLKTGVVTSGVIAANSVSASHLQGSAVTSGKIAASAVTSTALSSGAVTTTKIADDAITEPKLAVSNTPTSGQVLSYNGSALAWTSAGSSNPSMGGDLSGTASNAQIVASAVGTTELANLSVTAAKIANTTITDAQISATAAIAQTKVANLTTDLANKQPLDSDLTAIAGLSPTNDDVLQRKSGAWTNRTPAQLKADLTLTKSDVGLSNADNTSDASKPVSTATQTALNAKADNTTVVHLAGTETITGAKDFTGGLTVNATNVVVTSDSRLNDARTPTAHASTHEPGSSDALDFSTINLTGTLAAMNALTPSDYDGQLFAATDVGDGTLYRSNGSAWVQVAQSVSTAQGTATQPGGSSSVGTSSSQILAANANRKEFYIYNDHATNIVYLSLGGTAVVGQGPRINPNGDYFFNTTYTGAISAISTGASTNVTITEI